MNSMASDRTTSFIVENGQITEAGQNAKKFNLHTRTTEEESAIQRAANVAMSLERRSKFLALPAHEQQRLLREFPGDYDEYLE